MARVHQYIGLENLALTSGQRNTVLALIRRLGREDDGNPDRRMQPFPVRPDGQAVIYEAAFDDSDLDIPLWKTRLGTALSVDPATIDHTVTSPDFGAGSSTVVTFSRSGTDYARIALFGGVGASWEQSRIEVQAYLARYRDQWDSA